MIPPVITGNGSGQRLPPLPNDCYLSDDYHEDAYIWENTDGPIFNDRGRKIGERLHGIEFYSEEPYPGAWSLGDTRCAITPEQIAACQPRATVVTEVMWVAHNVLAHPFAELTHWLGFIWSPIRDFGLWIHDKTVPPHEPGTGRG